MHRIAQIAQNHRMLDSSVGPVHIDLDLAMRPHAERELLFWRDDGHWNRSGNQLAARLIAERLFVDPTS